MRGRMASRERASARRAEGALAVAGRLTSASMSRSILMMRPKSSRTILRSFSRRTKPDLSALPPHATKASIMSPSSSNLLARSFCFSMTLRNSEKSIVPLMFSSTSLIIWNSSSSVGFWPIAARTEEPEAEKSGRSRREHQAPALRSAHELAHRACTSATRRRARETPRICSALCARSARRAGTRRRPPGSPPRLGGRGAPAADWLDEAPVQERG